MRFTSLFIQVLHYRLVWVAETDGYRTEYFHEFFHRGLVRDHHADLQPRFFAHSRDRDVFHFDLATAAS